MKTNVFLASLPRGPGNFHALESTHLWRDLSLASKHSWDPFLRHTGKMQVQGRISVRHVFQIFAWQNANVGGEVKIYYAQNMFGVITIGDFLVHKTRLIQWGYCKFKNGIILASGNSSNHCLVLLLL